MTTTTRTAPLGWGGIDLLHYRTHHPALQPFSTIPWAVLQGVWFLSVQKGEDPTQAEIAAWVGCSERSVREGLRALRAAGLLTSRKVRRPWPLGGFRLVHAPGDAWAQILRVPTHARTALGKCSVVCEKGPVGSAPPERCQSAY